jgi:peptidoglycan/LPS O-acetylase OafA/YrhL
MQRNQSLDVLRCAAVLLTVGFHFPYYGIWGRIGWIGVDLFFVLSGFLISGLLFQEYNETGSINFRRFILRRGLKIWPSFYLFLIFIAALWTLKPSSLAGEQILYNVAWLQNYHASNSIFLIHTWSLAVEEHFYLLLPALLLLLIKVSRGRDPFRAIPALFILISVLCLASRWTLSDFGSIKDARERSLD